MTEEQELNKELKKIEAEVAAKEKEMEDILKRVTLINRKLMKYILGADLSHLTPEEKKEFNRLLKKI